MRSASSNSERVSFFKPGPARTFLENAGACTASILKPYPISGQRVCDFPFPVSNLFPNLRTKQNKQTTTTTKTYVFLDHDSRDSTTLFYLSFKRPKSKTNLRQTGLKTIFFGPTHERVMAPIPRPEPGQGPMGCKFRGLKAISFTSPLQVTFGNLHRKN